MRGNWRKGKIKPIGGMVDTSLDSLGIRQKILERQAIIHWGEVAGPQIAASSAADRIFEGVLYVCCKSSVWSQELSLHKQSLITRLNKSLGGPVIKDIRFTLSGYTAARARMLPPQERTVVRNLDKIELSEDQVKGAQEVAAQAPSGDLAEKIRRAIMTSKRMKELKIKEGWKTCSRCHELHDGEHEFCDFCR